MVLGGYYNLSRWSLHKLYQCLITMLSPEINVILFINCNWKMFLRKKRSNGKNKWRNNSAELVYLLLALARLCTFLWLKEIKGCLAQLLSVDLKVSNGLGRSSSFPMIILWALLLGDRERSYLTFPLKICCPTDNEFSQYCLTLQGVLIDFSPCCLESKAI